MQNLDASHRREPIRESDCIGVIDPGESPQARIA
jgi:hypothetical protein